VDLGGQEMAAKDEQEEEAVETQETSDNEDDEDEVEPVPELDRDQQWVTVTARYGRSSTLPARYRQELNAVDITGVASRITMH